MHAADVIDMGVRRYVDQGLGSIRSQAIDIGFQGSDTHTAVNQQVTLGSLHQEDVGLFENMDMRFQDAKRIRRNLRGNEPAFGDRQCHGASFPQVIGRNL